MCFVLKSLGYLNKMEISGYFIHSRRHLTNITLTFRIILILSQPTSSPSLSPLNPTEMPTGSPSKAVSLCCVCYELCIFWQNLEDTSTLTLALLFSHYASSILQPTSSPSRSPSKAPLNPTEAPTSSPSKAVRSYLLCVSCFVIHYTHSSS